MEYKDKSAGNSDEFTIEDLAKKIIEFSSSKSVLVYKKLPIDDPKQRKPSIELAKRILGWEPKFDLNEGLIKSIEWFKGEFDLFSE